MALFQIVSEGEGISALIKREQFMQMHSDLDKALTHLKTLVSINDIEITDATGEKHILKFNKIFEVMSQILSQISEKANKNGLTNIQERTNNMLNTIDNLRNYFCDDTNAIFLKDLEGIKKILADTN
jgi:GTP cyclohydrolase I